MSTIEWSLRPEKPIQGDAAELLCAGHHVFGWAHIDQMQIQRLHQIVLACNAHDSLMEIRKVATQLMAVLRGADYGEPLDVAQKNLADALNAPIQGDVPYCV